YYQVFDGRGAAFESDPHYGLRPFTAAKEVSVYEGGRVTQIPDSFPAGTAHTVLLAEAGEAVPVTKPAHLHFEPGKALPPLGGQFNEAPTFFRSQRRMGIHVVFADASVTFLSKEVDAGILRKLILRKCEKDIDPDDLS